MAIKNGGKILPTSYPKSLKVTAKFGFPVQEGSNTVPAAILQATLIQDLGFSKERIVRWDSQVIRKQIKNPVIFLSELDPDVQTLCKKFKKSTITLASGRPYVHNTGKQEQGLWGMKLTFKGALDLSKSINSQTIWNKRSMIILINLGLDLKDNL